MISSLKLRHWKSHEKTELSFGAGTNLIVGAMGSGKTSLMDAICFALYGTFPALRSRKITLDEVVMLRPRKYDSAEVELRFQAGGKTFTVSRVVRKGATEAFLRDSDSRLIEGPQSQRVTEAVEDLLKVDYELFTRSIYAEQNRIDYFIALGKGERKKQIDELLGIDKFETARATAGAVANKLKSLKAQSQGLLQGMDFEGMRKEKELLEGELGSLQSRAAAASEELALAQEKAGKQKKLVAQLEESEARASQLEKRKAAAEASLSELSAELERKKRFFGRKVTRAELEGKNALERELEGLRNARAEAAELDKKLERLRGEKEAVESQLKEFSSLKSYSLEGAREQAQKLSREVEAKRAEARRLSEAIASLKADGASAARDAAEAREKGGQLRVLVSAFQEKLSALGGLNAVREKQVRSEERLAGVRRELEEALVSVEVASTALSSLKAGTGECPVCGSPLSDEKVVSLKREKEGARAAAVEKARRLQEERALLEGELAELKQVLADAAAFEEKKVELAVLEERVKALEAKARKAADEAAQLAEAANALNAEIASLEESLSRARAEKDKLELKERLSAQLSRLTAEEQRLQALAAACAKRFSEQKILETEKKIEELRAAEEFFRVEDAVAEARKRLEDATRELSVLGFEAAQLASARQVLSSLEAQASVLRAESRSLAELLKEKRKRLDSVQSRLSLLEQRRNEIALLSSLVEELSCFQEALVQTQAELRQELVAAVNEAMSSLWRSLYPYGDYSSLMLECSEDDYSLKLQASSGEWVGIEEASGGEKSCASLALRVAFAMVLTPNLSWLVLDEPTHNLDSQAVSLLVSVLHDEIPKIVQQTFIITHDEALKEGASAKVYRVERDKERGDASVVEELFV
ncbi:MAG: AAA family ATPase [Candidatus Micrarchaeia archaeon]